MYILFVNYHISWIFHVANFFCELDDYGHFVIFLRVSNGSQNKFCEKGNSEICDIWYWMTSTHYDTVSIKLRIQWQHTMDECFTCTCTCNYTNCRLLHIQCTLYLSVCCVWHISLTFLSLDVRDALANVSSLFFLLWRVLAKSKPKKGIIFSISLKHNNNCYTVYTTIVLYNRSVQIKVPYSGLYLRGFNFRTWA